MVPTATAMATDTKSATSAPVTIELPPSTAIVRSRCSRVDSTCTGAGLRNTSTGSRRRCGGDFNCTATNNPIDAHTIVKKARTMEPMTEPMVPEGVSDAEALVRRQRWALPLLTMSWLLLGCVLIASVIRVERWELAPGEALTVAPRMSFTGSGASAPTRYAATNQIRFVTAFGGQITALDSFVGWLDPHVDVETYTQRFGERSPSGDRQVAFQAMYGAKQVAEFVALTKLGFDARFTEGPVVVGEVVCAAEPDPKSACKVLNIGDTITSFDGKEIAYVSDLSALVKTKKVGDLVKVSVKPDGEKSEVTREVRLMSNPDEPARVILGIVPADTRTVSLPFEVDINTADIGGPSAGLAFTLALLDELSPGELMGTASVAATGTINEKGEVGPIGALTQKAVAVRDAGAKVFLVPAGQSDEEIAAARRAAGSNVRIIPVATLDDALAELGKLGGDPLPR